MRREQYRRSGDSAAPELENRARHSDRDAVEGPKRCDSLFFSKTSSSRTTCATLDARCVRPSDLGAVQCNLFGHSGIRSCCGPDYARTRSRTRQEATAQQVLRRVRRPAHQSLLVRRVPARPCLLARRRPLWIFDEARWASQVCSGPHETAAVEAGRSLEIAASVVNDPMAGADVDDSRVR